MNSGQPVWQSLLPLVVIAVVIALRLRSMGRARPLNPGRLWIQPMILIAIAVFAIAAIPPGALGIALCVVALAIGGMVGWHRGKMMRIAQDAATGRLTQTASPAAILLLLAILVIRFAARSYFAGQPTPGKLDTQTLMVTDVLLSFAVAMVAASRIEIGLRARAILAAAPAPIDPPRG